MYEVLPCSAVHRMDLSPGTRQRQDGNTDVHPLSTFLLLRVVLSTGCCLLPPILRHYVTVVLYI